MFLPLSRFSVLRWAACLALSSAPAFAQVASPAVSSAPAGDEPVHLENVIVSATPFARPQDELVQATSVLAGRQLTQRLAPTLGETLAAEPGVTSTWFGPGASRPIIRGLGGDRIRVLENGTGVLDASITSPDHAVSLEPLLVERIEVVRGPASLLYGGSAVGGVVNVLTHRIHRELAETPLHGRIEARGDTAAHEASVGGLLDVSVPFTGERGLVLHLDGYRRTTDDLRIPGFAESAALRAAEHAEDESPEDEGEGHAEEAEAFGTVPNSAVETHGGSIGASFVSGASFLGFNASEHRALYGVPGHAHAPDEPGDEDHDHAADEPAPADEAVRIDLRQRRFDVQGELVADFALFTRAKVRFGTADYVHTELEGSEVGTRFTNRGYDGRFELEHRPLGALVGAWGVQAGHSDFAAAGAEAFVPPSETTTTALFAFEELKQERVTWQAGARIERQSIDAALADGPAARDATSLSASLGAVVPLGAAWSTSLALTHTERAPNAQELFADGPHVATRAYELGDATLGSEESLGVEVALRRTAGRVTGSLTAFVNSFSGYIFEQPTGTEEDGLPVYQTVQRDATFWGAEAEALVHLHEGARHALDLRLGADFVRATEEGSRHLPRIPPVRTVVGLDWAAGDLFASLEWRHVAAQDRLAASESRTPGYDLLLLGAGYRFRFDHVTCDLFARLNNLTDDEARVHTSFLKDFVPLPGRNFTAGVRVSF